MTGPGKPLLVELRTEELPPLLLGEVAGGFADNLIKALADARLCAPDAAVQHWSTPRRVAALLQGVAAQSAAATGMRRGPSVKNAYGTNGEPTKALAGFLKSNGARHEDLQEIDYKGQPYVAVPQRGGGEPLGDLLGPALERAVAKTVAPRLMRWGDTKHRFVRPIRGVCVIHGDQPVETEVFGKQTLSHSFGHRFLAPGEIQIEDASSYVDALRAGKVMVDSAERREAIRKQAKEISPEVRIDEGLLAEIVNMCEWPKCYSASFETKYQALPVKVVETCMGKHLRSFTVGNEKNLANEFVFVADNEPADAKPLRHNLEHVMQARLDDTLFIYEEDLKSKPEDMLRRLDDISHLQGMGSMRARCERIQELAEACAHNLELNEGEAKALREAARYIKADLGTLLVDEYPGLEGHIGSALLTELSNESRRLIGFHLDRSLDRRHDSARDALVLALELERLVSIAATLGLPKGSRDPQGLRRSMGRVLRILHRYRSVDLNELLSSAWDVCHAAAAQHGALAAKRFSADGKTLQHDLKRYAVKRLIKMAGDLLRQEFDQRMLNAITPSCEKACDDGVPINITNFLRRVEALKKFMDNEPELFSRMLATAKRLNNIGGKEKLGAINEKLFTADEEKSLYDACMQWAEEGLKFAQTHDYDSYYRRIIALAPKVDSLFDNVMINDEDLTLRKNRLNLVRFALGLLNAAIDTRKMYA